MLFLALLIPLYLQQVYTVVFDKEITTSSDSAVVSVASENECCCSYSLKYYLNLSSASSSCGINQNCTNCETFKIEKLYPNTKYIFYYTFPNETFLTKLIETKSLDVNLSIQSTSSTVNVTAEYNTHFEIKTCFFKVYKDDELYTACRNDCESCSNNLFHGLEPNTQYLVRYWNPYTKDIVNQSFSTKSSIFNVSVEDKYTSVMISISSNLQYYSNCNANLYVYPNKGVIFDCLNTPGCSTCGKFNITGLKPHTEYILTYTFDNRREIRDIFFKTNFIIIEQFYLQTRVDLIHVFVFKFHTVPETFHCNVNIISDHAKCRGSCPTNCSSYYIEITNLEPFNVSISSPEALNPHTSLLTPLKYNFHITSHYIDGHILNIVFTPNMKGGGNCTLKVYVMMKEVDYNCSNNKCPTDCDKLKFSLGNIDINSMVTFEILNEYIKEPTYLELDLISDVTMDEAIVTTTTKADFTVYHGGSCCCNATVKSRYSNKIYATNCQDNEACLNCSSFSISNLVANSEYTMLFTLPDGKIIERIFRTKPETIDVQLHSTTTEIDVVITSDVVMKVRECTFLLYDESEVIVSYCNYYCHSCNEHNFYALKSDTNYKFVFESIYLRKSYSNNIKTKPSKTKAYISYSSSYNYANITINDLEDPNETCDVIIKEIATDKKVPFGCFNTPGCRRCSNFTIQNLKRDTNYAIIVKFLSSVDEIAKHFYTKYIYLLQYATQTNVSEISVSISIYGDEFKSYHCTLDISGSNAKCNPCPDDCMSYKIEISSTEPFNVTLDSDMSYNRNVLRIVPIPYKIIFDYATYDGVILSTKFISNLKNAGLCTVEGYDGDNKINIKCDKSSCVRDCENLTLTITGINYNANFSLKIFNKYLTTPAVFPIKLNRNVALDKEIKVTSTSAFLSIIGGNTCCCKLLIHSNSPSTYIPDYCDINKDCRNCNSFYIEDLLPATSYTVEFTNPSGNISRHSLKSDYLHVKLVFYISFKSVEITVLNELGHHVMPTKCSISLSVKTKNYHSCYESCNNCTFMKFNSLDPNTTYKLVYRNFYALGFETHYFTTLDFKGSFPNMSDAAQLDYSSIFIVINNDTVHNYKGSYDIYAVKEDDVEFHIDRQAPLIKGIFDKDIKSLLVKMDLHYSKYMIVACFDILHDNCTLYPDSYYCLVCYQKSLKVCSTELLYNTVGKYSFINDKNQISISHTIKALTCHETLKCYITLIYVLRKDVSLNALDHYPERKSYFINGMGVNYIASLNETECQKEEVIISVDSTFSNKTFISLTDVFYTVSFVTCNSIACFPSRLYDKIHVPRGQSGTAIISIFCLTIFITCGLLFASSLLLMKYTPDSFDDIENHGRKSSAASLSTDGITGDSDYIKDTATLTFAMSSQ